MKLKTILIIVACVLAGLAVCLFLGYLGVSPFTALYGYAANAVSGFDLSTVTSNPTALVTTATATIGTATAVGIPLYNKYKTMRQQAEQTKELAQNEIKGLTTKLEDQKITLENAQTKISNLEQLTAQSNQAIAYARQVEQEKAQLQTQYNELKDLIRVNGLKPDATDTRVIVAAEEAQRIP